MIEVVRHPGGEQLSKRDDAERRMPPGSIEIAVAQLQRGQRAQVLAPQRRELLEPRLQRLRLRRFELRLAIERVERPALAVPR